MFGSPVLQEPGEGPGLAEWLAGIEARQRQNRSGLFAVCRDVSQALLPSCMSLTIW